MLEALKLDTVIEEASNVPVLILDALRLETVIVEASKVPVCILLAVSKPVIILPPDIIVVSQSTVPIVLFLARAPASVKLAIPSPPVIVTEPVTARVEPFQESFKDSLPVSISVPILNVPSLDILTCLLPDL